MFTLEGQQQTKGWQRLYEEHRGYKVQMLCNPPACFGGRTHSLPAAEAGSTATL